MKKVQVNTPLILEQNGELVRIDTGSVIELPDDVYAEVSAHTTLIDDVRAGEKTLATDVSAGDVDETSHSAADDEPATPKPARKKTAKSE